ncbi:hypothetical protein PG997_010772 [Apiospora hydei]|uniref:NB-ARC domain-containing protein n=1 Tax=Apiospora hydei TaxID=1337664 RepID=A0ABR1VH74_9PEZI
MSDTIGSGSGTSQTFGNSSVGSGGRLFQGIVKETSICTPSPTILIPFSRDADFVQRGEIMDRLHQRRAQSFSRTALVGLGGVGKSQLAIEYAYQVRERSPETWVFWIFADTARRFEMDFQNIATYARLPGQHSPRADVLQLVTNWLVSESSGEWVIILDNVDSADFMIDSTQSPHPNRPHLVSYLPSCEKGSILVTSRNKNATLKLVELRNIIQVDPMSQEEAVALAEKKLGKSDDKMKCLADSLEYVPLAIVQAAAYITRLASLCSVNQYLERFAQSDHDKASLLNFEGGQLRRDPEAKNSIIITWQLMFDHIHRTRPSAAHLLSYMSVFNSQLIVIDMLRPPVFQSQRPTVAKCCPLHNMCKSSKMGFSEEDILHLADCSLISTRPDGQWVQMHSLVQLATRRWLQAAGDRGFDLWQDYLFIVCTAYCRSVLIPPPCSLLGCLRTYAIPARKGNRFQQSMVLEWLKTSRTLHQPSQMTKSVSWHG